MCRGIETPQERERGVFLLQGADYTLDLGKKNLIAFENAETLHGCRHEGVEGLGQSAPFTRCPDPTAGTSRLCANGPSAPASRPPTEAPAGVLRLVV